MLGGEEFSRDRKKVGPNLSTPESAALVSVDARTRAQERATSRKFGNPEFPDPGKSGNPEIPGPREIRKFPEFFFPRAQKFPEISGPPEIRKSRKFQKSQKSQKRQKSTTISFLPGLIYTIFPNMWPQNPQLPGTSRKVKKNQKFFRKSSGV